MARFAFGWVHLTRAEFDALPNYSCSMPTDIAIGKAWKRAKKYNEQTDDPNDWLVWRYEEYEEPDRVGTAIAWYKINIVEED